MKRYLLLTVAILFICSPGFAQVFADFETGTNDYVLNNWGGTAITGISKVTDPTAQSTGVLQVAMNFTKKTNGSFGVTNPLTVPTGAQLLTYWVYLPPTTPDSVVIGIYVMDNKNWSWFEPQTYAKDIPKEKWYPLSCGLAATSIKNANFDVVANKLATGIQIANWNVNAADSVWAGNILIDNVSWVGVQPKVYADFSGGIGDFKSLWGGPATLSTITDPAGNRGSVAQVALTTATAVGYENQVDASKSDVLVLWVYLPPAAPDDLLFKVFAQDNNSWAWNEQDYLGKDIPKEKWYPLYFDMEAVKARTTNFNHITYKLGKFGVEIANLGTWTGNVLIDDIGLLGTEVGQKWVQANFDNAAAGVSSFAITSYGPAGTALTREVISTNGVLQLAVNGSLGTGENAGKWAIHRPDISIYYQDKDTLVDALGIDILVPSDYPTGSPIDIVFQPTSDWAWLSKSLPIKDSAGCVAPGKWSTIKWNIAEFRSSIVDRQAKGYFVLQSIAATFTGNIQFDNFTVFGRPQPAGVLVSPNLTAYADTGHSSMLAVVDFVKFEWTDLLFQSETYNIYKSTSPISSLTGAAVQKIAQGIPHGFQSYGFRPYSTNGDTATLYFAITATESGVESGLTSGCKKGPIKVKTTPTMKIKYVADFASTFVLDGLDSEFENHKQYQIVPENAGDSASISWTPASEDLNFKTTVVIDDNYLYISADVTDDDINTSSNFQTWQGDAIEFFIGYYNLKTLKAWHGKNFQGTNGDWRIGFNTLGNVTLDGYRADPVPGVQFALYQKLFGGSGYIIEARLTLDSLAAGNDFGPVINGMQLPFKIDANDVDPVVGGDVGRTLICQVGTNPFSRKADLDQEWVRPHTWGVAEVIGGGAAVETEILKPYEYKLYDNYPNPFNPSTTVQYELKES